MTNKNNTVLINFLVRLPIRSSSITIDLDLKHYQLYEPTNGDYQVLYQIAFMSIYKS